MELMKIALSLGILILYSAFIIYAVDIFYEGPKYEDYCNGPSNCYTEYTEANKSYTLKTSYIFGAIGILSIIFGAFKGLKIEVIASGILGGGIVLILWSAGSILFDTELNKYAKLGILGVALLILIVIGYMKIEKKLKKR